MMGLAAVPHVQPLKAVYISRNCYAEKRWYIGQLIDSSSLGLQLTSTHSTVFADMISLGLKLIIVAALMLLLYVGQSTKRYVSNYMRCLELDLTCCSPMFRGYVSVSSAI
jgi:uncharacterized membrane protein